MADAWDFLEEELAAAPCLPGVKIGFLQAIEQTMEAASPGDAYQFGLAWGEHERKKGLRYTTIMRIPAGTKKLPSPASGIAWFFGIVRGVGGSADQRSNTILHDDSCRCSRGGRAWECNCVSDIVVDHVPTDA